MARAEAASVEAAQECRALHLEQRAAEIRAGHRSRRPLIFAGRRRREDAQLEARRLELDAALLRAERWSRNAERQRQRASDRLVASESAVSAGAGSGGSAATIRLTALELEERKEELLAAIPAGDDVVDGLRPTADAVPGAETIVDHARRLGILEQLDERDRLNAIVAALDADERDIERDLGILADEMRQTRARLVAETPVVACTLASLTTHPELAKRRFDVVILDEAASVDPASVVHAGSRADRTFVLVGDFLQNAPIADVDDPTSKEGEQQAAWQEQDFFGLAGIHSRATAEAHPRCVPLRLQYRYPSVMASIVNAFCYDGMLESHRTSAPADGPTITMVDTSLRLDKDLRRQGGSWYSPLGLDVLASIARGLGGDANTVGFVCPHKAQAKRARDRIRDEGLPVECGTSHGFQGREFEAVIFDLMQDDTERWVAVADLAGPRRAVAAAKLLNVGITRARLRLYLIGDWRFIRRHHSPGMAAIAALEGHVNFEVVDAGHLL